MPLPNITDLCVVTAVDVEFNAATSLLLSKIFSTESQVKICRGNLAHRRITVLQCGMGAPGFGKWLAAHLKTNRYDALLIAGLGGGLNPHLKSGDIVLYDICHEGRGFKEKPSGRDEKARLRCNDDLLELLQSSLAFSGRSYTRSSGVTVSRIITEAKEKILLGESYQAAAVDMESYDVLGICEAFHLPAAVLRIISDEAGGDLPDFNYAVTADGQMNIWRTAVAMAMRPAASLRFLRSIRPVLKSLEATLKVVLNV